MVKLTDLLTGTRILAESDSKYNGHMRVVRDITWGTYIQADGLTQTGGVVTSIWTGAFRKIKKTKPQVETCLILGLGGGTVAKLVRKYYPTAEITGVDIDPAIVNWGEEYFGLKTINVKTVIGDAYGFIKTTKDKYDLIIIDIYQGKDYPKQFKSLDFLKLIRSKLLTPNGLAVFNRLYYGEKRPEAMKFLKLLEKEFSSADPIYPQANILFLCKS